MYKKRHGKIIATLGPASSSAQVIEKLLKAGVDLFRLNFSHGTHQEHQERLSVIRNLAHECPRPIGVLADLQGPKLRVGVFEASSVILAEGEIFTLDQDPSPGDKRRVCLPHPVLFEALKSGETLLLDDGKLALRVEDVSPAAIRTTVVNGGMLSDRKGVNVPQTTLPFNALTDKDKLDLAFALECGVDFIGLSFVQRPEDVQEALDLIQGRAQVISKIEKPQAIACLEDIVRLSDGVMVARGDLGVEMAPEEVPALQKKIIQICRQRGKPVIVATQMLESMINAPRPTRAEASDVATAIYEGVDAVMLSAESAAGSYPLEAVQMMSRVIEKTEEDQGFYTGLLLQEGRRAHDYEGLSMECREALTRAACQVAGHLRAKAIVTFTTSGSTPLRAARMRSPIPVIALTSSAQVYRRLSLPWGVSALKVDRNVDFEQMRKIVSRALIEAGIAVSGDVVVVTAGVGEFVDSDQRLQEQNLFVPGSTNMIQVVEVNPYSH